MTDKYRLEFRKKSGSKRRNIFKNRIRGEIYDLMKAFDKDELLSARGVKFTDSTDKVANAIIASVEANERLLTERAPYNNEKEFIRALKQRI